MDDEDQQPVLDTSYDQAYNTAQQYTSPSSSAPLLSPTALEYLPSVLMEGSPETKCLIVLDVPVPVHSLWRQNCMFRLVCQQSYRLIALDWVTDNVLRCNLPTLHSGFWSITIVSGLNVRQAPHLFKLLMQSI